MDTVNRHKAQRENAWRQWRWGWGRKEAYADLYDRYNTFTSSIQDPDAFYSDLCEIGSLASTKKQFHQLMEERKAQRLDEVKRSMEFASCEIISNPDLIGTKQWEYAVELFRARSLDTLILFFSSYLPKCHSLHSDDESATTFTSTREGSESGDSTSSPPPQKPFFDDCPLTEEPPSYSSEPDSHDAHNLPPSPRSMTTCSDESNFHTYHLYDNLTPPRTTSYSGSESDNSYGDDASPASSGPETPHSISEDELSGFEPDFHVEDHDHHDDDNEDHDHIHATTDVTKTPTQKATDMDAHFRLSYSAPLPVPSPKSSSLPRRSARRRSRSLSPCLSSQSRHLTDVATPATHTACPGPDTDDTPMCRSCPMESSTPCHSQVTSALDSSDIRHSLRGRSITRSVRDHITTSTRRGHYDCELSTVAAAPTAGRVQKPPRWNHARLRERRQRGRDFEALENLDC